MFFSLLLEEAKRRLGKRERERERERESNPEGSREAGTEEGKQRGNLRDLNSFSEEIEMQPDKSTQKQQERPAETQMAGFFSALSIIELNELIDFQAR